MNNSKLCGQLVIQYNQNTGLSEIQFLASTAFIAGLVEFIFGILRLGIIVDFISAPVIAGFTSGAAISIICSQLSGLFGISGLNTNLPAYMVLGNTIASLNRISIDAAFGISTIIFLVLWRHIGKWMIKKKFKCGRLFGQAGNIVALVLFTLISFIINFETKVVKIVGSVPSGINYVQIPNFLKNFSAVYPAAVTVVLVAIMEHIAIAKSFGRHSGYKIKPNQEIIALGLVNMIGCFFGAYPATGSFSRSAVKSRSGVKTPLADFFTAAVVIVSIFYLTSVFYWIPSASLSGIIVFSITDLISRPKTLVNMFKFQLTDFLSYLVALVVTFFTSIEVGIFVSVAFSVLVLLYRVARPKFSFFQISDGKWKSDSDHRFLRKTGIAIFRIEESLTYPNANYITEKITNHIESNTSAVENPDRERLWCEEHPKSASKLKCNESFPIANPNYECVIDNRNEISAADLQKYDEGILISSTSIPTLMEKETGERAFSELKVLILEFSAVNNIDSTGLQCLLDIRDDLLRHTGGRTVPILFINVRERLTKSIHIFHSIVTPHFQVTPMVAHMNDDSSNSSAEANKMESSLGYNHHHDNEHGGCSLIFRSIEDAINVTIS